MMSIVLLALTGCGSDTPAWAIHHLELSTDATGVSGTQVWEFFGAGWDPDTRGGNYLCTRAQEVKGAVLAAPAGCPSCTVAYGLSVSELATDCTGDVATSASYVSAITISAIGEVDPELANLDPYPGKSVGWYTSLDGGETLVPYGFAYDAALDEGTVEGPPGWVNGGRYVLWAAYAWEL